ncbi:G-type lectin S-receptor-like serine/threonine-protein kinase At4g03230 [Olea europaea var. sylvestris]|uniref:G-type lectin S-receptor-like serine/threonine-protein kinase At4g03230 n=1 Tax=Olea europaea var. sylvestris TaxID=158386 RepID=UPI000C1D784A|nr:G-type lectin S-receptor-like serine/threonine-protein kinase At4g03230 [Olea europaea var. sylvestris]
MGRPGLCSPESCMPYGMAQADSLAVAGHLRHSPILKVGPSCGYMSLEYVSYGQFSIKSDAWRLWSEKRALDLLDPMILKFCEKSEVVGCINIGLLCAEKDPIDRPTMSNVVLMLSSETTFLPVPKQLAFAMRKHISSTSSSSSNKPDPISNKLTMSEPQGR